MSVQKSLMRVSLAALCLALLALAGCKRERATVSGTVTFNKRPLTAGTISFVAAGNLMGTGTIKPDGTYTVNDAPVGEVTVTVSTPPAPVGAVRTDRPPKDIKGMPADLIPGGDQALHSVKIVPAPEKYKTPEKSPLKTTIHTGAQTYDADLTP
jgi:hypothetical protein